MKIRTRLLAVAGATAIVGSMAFAAAPAGARVHPQASTPVNVLADHVQCNTITGSIKFATKLTLTGPTTGNNTTTVKLAASGCVDQDQSLPQFAGTITGALSTTGGTNCTGLLTPGAATGNTKVVWKNPTGKLLQPTDPITNLPQSLIGVTNDQGGTFLIPSGEGPWTGTGYAQFHIGAAFSLNPTTQTGATNLFKGGADNGASGWFAGTTQQDAGNLLNTCVKGLSGVTFGMGAAFFG